MEPLESGPMRDRNQILEMLADRRETLHGLGVRKLALFGSAARGANSPSSDLDFVVELARETFDAYMGVKEFLEETFGCRVDLVLEKAIKPRLRERILSEAVHAPGL